MTESQKLLAEYAESGSEAAFRELVARYIDLVYSTALRFVDGDSQLAEDVTQTVFIHLSRKARQLARDSMLGGWLHRDTCYVASNALRRERRRRAREREAATMNSPQDHSNLDQITAIVDQAINRLGESDRTAILLRFFEQRDFRSVGLALGTSEDAARMRVTRALDKLQSILKRRGISLPASALASALASQAVSAAPAGMAASVAGTVVATAATAGGISGAVLNIMTITKFKGGVALVVAGMATPLAIQHHANVKLREQNAALQQRLEPMSRLSAENERLSNLLAQASTPDERMSELLRLRGEVALLRKMTNELASLRESNRGLQAALAAAKKMPGDALAQNPPRSYANQRGRVAKILAMPLILYASDNQRRLPATFEQASQYFAKAYEMDPFMRDAAEFADLGSQFEIVYNGPLDELKDPGSVILLREREPWRAEDGKLLRAYATADGAGHIGAADSTGSFATYEQRLTGRLP